jgi:hypothetical protein
MNALPVNVRNWIRLEARTRLMAIAVIGGVAMTFSLYVAGDLRLLIAAVIAFVVTAMAMVNIRIAILGMVIFLTFLGDLRRMIIPAAGWSGTDPLLLIGPLFAILVFAYGWASGKARVDTPLAKWSLFLIVIMTLQVFNPRQGGLMVGMAGIMFLMVPLFWFWIGRTFLTEASMNTLLLNIVLPLSGIALMMGLYQVFYGYLDYQMDWYWIAGYTALGNPNIGLAPISLFASATEYGNYLIVAMAIITAYGLTKNRSILLLLPLFFAAVFLTGSRGPVVKILLVGTGLVGVLGPRKTWLVRGLFTVVIGVAGFAWVMSGIDTSPPEGPRTSLETKFSRQAQVLDGPGQKGSTWRIHGYMMIHGYVDGFTDPLGLGLGSVTKAAMKFGGQAASTEADASNVFRATGLFGGVAYHVMIFFIIVSAFRYWDRTRKPVALAILGILGVTFLLWLGGGQYAISPLVWLCIGALDRFENGRDTRTP